MELHFQFREKLYSCIAIIDTTDYPCYIFTIQKDPEIVREFGDEVSIKTDCERLLPKEDDHPQLMDLRLSIFRAITQTADFMIAKSAINKFGVQ